MKGPHRPRMRFCAVLIAFAVSSSGCMGPAVGAGQLMKQLTRSTRNVTFEIVDGRSGQPIVNARVRAAYSTEWGGPEPVQGFTDASGKVRLQLTVNAYYALDVSAGGYWWDSSSVPDWTWQDPPPSIRIGLFDIESQSNTAPATSGPARRPTAVITRAAEQ